MENRPPIIVVLGHVDHGKTTLLDHIRAKYTEKARPVAEREAGGITQSIGAYEIVRNKEKITFIDTPGHEAFSLMRMCGTEIADIAILLVAADDGVNKQTKEALECITKTNTPYVVAINKVDLPGANVEKTKNDLAQAGVYIEGQGGNISWQEISAKTGQGVEELLDLLSLASQVEELKYDPKAVTEGFVITSKQDARRGIQVGVVAQNGTLTSGSYICTPTTKGKIRSLENFLGESVKELEPSAPALISGWSEIPHPGEIFVSCADEENAQKTIDQTEKKKTLTHNLKTEQGENIINVILKADEAGSLEALRGLIAKLTATEKQLHVIDEGVGNIIENDVKTAVNSKAVVVGFRSKVEKAAENIARGQNIHIHVSDVIYELEKKLKHHLKEALRKPIGVLEVLAVFGERKGKEQIVGGKVVEGKVVNQSSFEIHREDEKIGEGKIQNLQSKKEDIQEVEEEKECGLLSESDIPIAAGQKLLFFE
tara:strand:+ start:3413 stop:4867 length:1455 start_codon:yes stop_codon:yes gene_type:complete